MPLNTGALFIQGYFTHERNKFIFGVQEFLNSCQLTVPLLLMPHSKQTSAKKCEIVQKTYQLLRNASKFQIQLKQVSHPAYGKAVIK